MIPEYSPAEIEPKWREKWAADEAHRTPDPSERPTFYCLDFFPYPSGSGISVGHMRNYVPSDVVSRYMRMRGYDVLHPMMEAARAGQGGTTFGLLHGLSSSLFAIKGALVLALLWRCCGSRG